MKMIDAHLHLFEPGVWTRQMARAAGHDPEPAALQRTYESLGVCAGVVMGNQTLAPDAYRFPPFFRYCIAVGEHGEERADPSNAPELAELHLQRPACVGMKIYAGYNMTYVSDPCFEPYYALARKYGKPVAIHTGMTAGSHGGLKYSHPLTVDEVAAAHPDVQFVMCHFGNPFLADAAAVMEKNPNVAADLSGLLAGTTDLAHYFARHAGYVELLRTWIRYIDDDSRFLFGTDFPAANIPNCIELVTHLVDEASREKVFFDNANRIYGLGL